LRGIRISLFIAPTNFIARRWVKTEGRDKPKRAKHSGLQQHLAPRQFFAVYEVLDVAQRRASTPYPTQVKDLTWLAESVADFRKSGLHAVALGLADGADNRNHAKQRNAEQQGINDQGRPPQTMKMGASLSPTSRSLFSIS
jgi:hypothetical protein